MLNSFHLSHNMKQKLLEKSVTTIQEKPIQDRLRNASCITVESALRNKVNLNVSWYDVHGQEQSQKYSISAGSVIEF